MTVVWTLESGWVTTIKEVTVSPLLFVGRAVLVDVTKTGDAVDVTVTATVDGCTETTVDDVDGDTVAGDLEEEAEEAEEAEGVGSSEEEVEDVRLSD